MAPSDLAQPKVRERLRPPTDIMEWRELAALIEKGWDRVHEVRPCTNARLTKTRGVRALAALF